MFIIIIIIIIIIINIIIIIGLYINFFCSDNITARNSKTKCYKKLQLSRCSGDLSTGVASNFMRASRKSDIMDFLY